MSIDLRPLHLETGDFTSQDAMCAKACAKVHFFFGQRSSFVGFIVPPTSDEFAAKVQPGFAISKQCRKK